MAESRHACEQEAAKNCSARDAGAWCSSLPALYVRVTFAADMAHTQPASISKTLPGTDPALLAEQIYAGVLPDLDEVYLQCPNARHPTVACKGRKYRDTRQVSPWG